jgi:DNA ligase-1
MQLPTLYSRTATGAIQTWTVEIEGDSYRTIHGQLDGKLQTTEWTVCLTTNENRANQRTPEEQALFEAQASWTKKKDTGYHVDISKIDTSEYVEPMLAKKWEDRKDKVKFPVYSQPKYDGLRCVITKDGAKSRNGKPWLTIPHILEALEPIFKQYPELILDGELYNHKLKHDFNKITSLVKKTKPTDEDLVESSKMVQFWWYDTASDKHTFRQRANWINTLDTAFKLPDCIIPVPTAMCKTLSELDKHYEQYMSDGYEGQMVRLDTPYEFKRSANLLKRKEFQDEEYKILDIVEGVGNRAGSVGSVLLVTDSGEEFSSSLNGSMDFCAEVLKNKHNYIGKMATVKFFNFTPPPRSVPRFPKITTIRDYE